MARKITVLLSLVAFSMIGVAGCSRQEDPYASRQSEEISLAISSWPGSAPIYIAQEKGYFQAEGLAVTLHPFISGHLALDAMLSGKADLATASDTPISRAAIEGKPLAVVATVSEIERAILIIARKDPGISAPEDLRGRKIGLAAGSAAEFFLHIFLTTSLINPKEVRIVDLAPDRLVEALLNGEVDAAAIWPPYTIVLREKLGSRAFIFQDPKMYSMSWNIVAKQDFVKSHPDRVKRFLRALVRANKFIAEQPGEALPICSKNIGTDSSLLEKEWGDYHFNVMLEQSLILTLEDQARWMIRGKPGRPRTPPNFMEFIHTDALKAVKPEAVSIVGR